jgi:hypothetical protein
MATRAYNLVWMSPRYYRGGQTEVRQPIQSATMENIFNIAKQNPETEVKFWTDFPRMAPSQLSWLEANFSDCLTHNLKLHDLRTIPAFANEEFYSQEDDFANWRSHKDSLIWRQVDSARILATLQGSYGQTFYSDVDITNLVINTSEVQKPMKKYGLIIGGGGLAKPISAWYENQLFGFDERQRSFFRELYTRTLQGAIYEKRNGYAPFVNLIRKELIPIVRNKKIGFIFRAKYDRTEAAHPGQQPEERRSDELLFPAVLRSTK